MAISVPLGLSAPTAAPSRAENSGVNSTLVRPFSPYELKSPRFHEPAQMIESCTTAPGSTSLLGQMRTLALTVAPAPSTTSLPMTLPSSSRHPFLTVTDRQTTEPRSRELRPTYEWSQRIELETFTPEPISAGPTTRAPSEMSASSWIQRPSPLRSAGMSTLTRPSRQSKFAFTYAA